MYTVDSLENAIRDLYCSGISSAGYERASVEAMLDSLDFCALLQAVRHNAGTVHTYTTQGRASKSFNYRGGELFDQRATRLYPKGRRTRTESCLSASLSQPLPLSCPAAP